MTCFWAIITITNQIKVCVTWSIPKSNNNNRVESKDGDFINKSYIGHSIEQPILSWTMSSVGSVLRSLHHMLGEPPRAAAEFCFLSCAHAPNPGPHVVIKHIAGGLYSLRRRTKSTQSFHIKSLSIYQQNWHFDHHGSRPSELPGGRLSRLSRL